jgi:hypothetical protein
MEGARPHYCRSRPSRRVGAHACPIRRRAEANRIQDAYNSHTVQTLRYAALSNPTAGRGEHTGILATSAMAAMIGLQHQP